MHIFIEGRNRFFLEMCSRSHFNAPIELQKEALISYNYIFMLFRSGKEIIKTLFLIKLGTYHRECNIHFYKKVNLRMMIAISQSD